MEAAIGADAACDNALAPLYAFQTLPGMVLSFCLMQFGVTWAYIAAVTAEILPTRVRATGLGLSVAVGRVGAMLAPLLLTFAYQTSGKAGPALPVLFALAAPGPIAAVLWWLKGIETRNISLEQGSEDLPVSAAAAE
jgi:MFS family permease